MITDKDVEKLKETFATKGEFQSLEGRVGNLEVKVDGLIYEVGDLKVEMGEVKERLGSIEVTIDRIAGGVDTLLQENAAGGVILSRHSRQISALALHAGATLPD